LQNPNYFFFTLSHSFVTYNVLSFSSVSRIKYFRQHNEILWTKYRKFINFFICLTMIPIRYGRIRIGMPWMSARIQQNDADPTRSATGSESGSITMQLQQ
jgi:hypothetical protein